MSRPLVSVLMAARNHEYYAADAVASIIEQDYERLELIAVDDASDDSTADVLEACAAGAPPGRMRVVRHERQQGIAATRAHALRLAEGELIGMLDSDDLWLPGKLLPQVDLLEANHEVGLVHAAVEAFDSATGEPVPWSPDWDSNADQLVELVRVGCFVMPGTALIRRAAIDTRGVGFVNPGYDSYDDYLLFLVLALDWKFAYEERPVMRYRRHGKNLTNVLFAGNLARARAALLERFLREFPEASDRLDGEARRTLAQLHVKAAAHNPRRDWFQSFRWAWTGFREHPRSALTEARRVARFYLRAGRS
jgi:glycosyltransferase involved in cell wall biosynthesis